MIQCRYVCRLNTVKKSEEQLPREKKLVRDVQLTKKDYTKLFQDNLITFLKPLTVQKGYLTYTAGFARTVANLQGVTLKSKYPYFKQIKKSIVSSKKLTPKSCCNICQILTQMPFEGDEGQVIQKLITYVSTNHYRFSDIQIDTFNFAYKQIMVNKAFGSVKFKPFDFKRKQDKKKDALSLIINDIKTANNFKDCKVNTFRESTSVTTFIRCGAQTVKAKIIAVPKNNTYNSVDIEREVSSQEAVVLVYQRVDKTLNAQSYISLANIGASLQQISTAVSTQSNIPLHWQALLKSMSTLKKISDKYKQCIAINRVEQAKIILRTQSLQQIRQFYGYTKLLNFHYQFERTVNNLPSQTGSPTLNYFANMQSEDLREFNMNAQSQRIIQQILDYLQHNPTIKSIAIYIGSEYLEDFLILLTNTLSQNFQNLRSNNKTLDHQCPIFQQKAKIICSLTGLQLADYYDELTVRHYKRILLPHDFRRKITPLISKRNQSKQPK